MKQSLNAIAHLTNRLIQATLLAKSPPATDKKMMCALKRVLREARQLELMEASNYTTAVDLPKLKADVAYRIWQKNKY
jgi:integrase/recombinase XerD